MLKYKKQNIVIIKRLAHKYTDKGVELCYVAFGNTWSGQYLMNDFLIQILILKRLEYHNYIGSKANSARTC